MTWFAFWESNTSYNVQVELKVESLARVQVGDGDYLCDTHQ